MSYDDVVCDTRARPAANLRPTRSRRLRRRRGGRPACQRGELLRLLFSVDGGFRLMRELPSSEGPEPDLAGDGVAVGDRLPGSRGCERDQSSTADRSHTRPIDSSANGWGKSL